MKSFPRLIFIAVLFGLASCSGNDVSDTLGLAKQAPDEFVVVSRPPLVVPPEFELRPPHPGEESPHVKTTEDQARKLLLGTEAAPATLDALPEQPATPTAVTPVLQADTPSAATSNFLKQAGADKGDDQIRDQLGADVNSPAKKDAKSLYEKVVGDQKEETVVDPAKEAARLRANKDAGKPVTEGDTPTQDTPPPSVLDRVF